MPPECAKPPLGKAESASCQSNQSAEETGGAVMVSEQEVTLSERQYIGGLTSEKLTIGANFVRLGIDRNFRQGIVPTHLLLSNFTAIAYGFNTLGEAVS